MQWDGKRAGRLCMYCVQYIVHLGPFGLTTGNANIIEDPTEYTHMHLAAFEVTSACILQLVKVQSYTIL